MPYLNGLPRKRERPEGQDDFKQLADKRDSMTKPVDTYEDPDDFDPEKTAKHWKAQLASYAGVLNFREYDLALARAYHTDEMAMFTKLWRE